MVTVEPALCFHRVQMRRDRVQHARLEPGDGGSHANGIHNDAVVIHRVGAGRGEAAGVVAVEFVQKEPAELVREELERIDPLSLLAEQRADRATVPTLEIADGGEERWVDPLCPAVRAVKELRVTPQRRVRARLGRRQRAQGEGRDHPNRRAESREALKKKRFIF